MPVGATAQLEMRWVPVTTPDGRAQMESVWIDPTRVAAERTVEAPLTSTPLASGAQHAA